MANQIYHPLTTSLPAQMMPSSTIEPKIRRSRASRPKVKTGCQTCKIRRVKCDETKPACMRCVRFGHKCDGYNYMQKPGVKPTLVTNIAPRTLVPRSEYLPISPVTSPTSIASTPPSITGTNTSTSTSTSPRSIGWRSDPNPGEASFRNFCRQLSGTSNSHHHELELWWGLVFAACEASPLIFDTVHMIGALDLRPKEPENEVGTFRHMSSFRDYINTRCLIKKRAVPFSVGRAEGTIDVEMQSKTTLMAILLSNTMGNDIIGNEREISKMFLGLRTLRDWATRTYLHRGGQLGSLGKVDILKAFGKMEMRLLHYSDSIMQHERRRSLGPEDVEMMPGRFSTLMDAKEELERIITKSMDWLASTLRRHDFTCPGTAATSTSTSDDYEEDRGRGMFFDIDPRFEEEKRTLREYERWNRSFMPLYERSQNGKEDDEKCRYEEEIDPPLAQILRMLWLAGYVLIASSNHLNGKGLVKERFATQLQELKGIARGLRASASWRLFKVRSVLPLMVVGWEDRDRVLRKLAVNMLLGCARDEVLVNRGKRSDEVVGRVMDSLVEMEEEKPRIGTCDVGGGLAGSAGSAGEGKEDEGNIVNEGNTVTDIEMSFDSTTRAAYIRCRKVYPVAGVEDSMKIKEVVIPW